MPGGLPVAAACSACQAGTTNLFCGKGGQACVVCMGNHFCQDGVCVGQCNSSNCPGFCDGNVCKPGNTAEACGEKGAQCMLCEQGKKVCQQFSGGCVIDTASKWQVQLLRVSITESLAQKTCGADFWSPDLFVSLHVSTEQKDSTTKVDSCTPKWNREPLLTATASELRHAYLMVYDQDPNGVERVASFWFSGQLSDNSFDSGVLDLISSEGVMVELRLAQVQAPATE